MQSQRVIMLLQVEFVFPLHMISATILAILVWVATGIIWFRLRKSGGIATLFYVIFFGFMGFMAICDLPSVSASTPEQATFWGTLGLVFGLSAWFAVYLSGEYSTSDQPQPWRIVFIGIWYGVCVCGLFITFLLPPNAGAIVMIYVSGYGWTLSLAPFFLFPVGIFIVGSISLFFRFCFSVYRAAPNSPYGRRVRVFVYVITSGLGAVVAMSISRFLFIEFAMYFLTLEMVLSSIFIKLVFYLFYKEPSIVFLLAQKATCVFILNTGGTVFFEHSFEKSDTLTEYIDLFAPALTAVNFIVQESLELREVEWIRQFSTNQRTFLLDVRLEADLIGVLLVSKPTQMLRRGLSRLMADLITELSLRGTQIDFSWEMKKKFEELLPIAFPFLKS